MLVIVTLLSAVELYYQTDVIGKRKVLSLQYTCNVTTLILFSLKVGALNISAPSLAIFRI